MRVGLSAVVSVMMLFGASATAQPKFAGYWIIDASKVKDFKGIEKGEQSLDITQRGDVLVIKNVRGHTRSFKLDGSENVNEPFGKAADAPNTLAGTYRETTKARLNGASLTIDGGASDGNVVSEMVDVYTLSGNGKTLTRKRTVRFSAPSQSESTVEMIYLRWE